MMLSAGVLGQVLVVADGASPICDTLIRAGYQVIIARDGEQAMAVAAQIKCDVALVDLDRVEMSGMEIIRRLKASVADLEVISLEGWGEHPLSDQGRADVDDAIFQWLYKPIEMSLLRRTVRRAVERRALLRENERLHHAVNANHSAGRRHESSLVAPRPVACEAVPRHTTQRGADRLRETEVKTIVAALVKTQWNQRRTAELLNISYSALRRRIAKYHLTPCRNMIEFVERA